MIPENPADPAPKTISIEEAGKRYFNLSRNASYTAAKNGFIPTIKIGARRMRVPVKALEARLAAVE